MVKAAIDDNKLSVLWEKDQVRDVQVNKKINPCPSFLKTRYDAVAPTAVK